MHRSPDLKAASPLVLFFEQNSASFALIEVKKPRGLGIFGISYKPQLTGATVTYRAQIKFTL